MCDDQASDLAKQLEECRRVVPQQIMEKLQEHLENVRPNAELTDDGGVAQHSHRAAEHRDM